jgi:hypothetical protein
MHAVDTDTSLRRSRSDDINRHLAVALHTVLIIELSLERYLVHASTKQIGESVGIIAHHLRWIR